MTAWNGEPLRKSAGSPGWEVLADESAEGAEEDDSLASQWGPSPPALPSCKSNDRLFRRRRALAALAHASAGLLAVCGCAAACLWIGRGGLRSWAPGDGSIMLWGACDYSTASRCPALSLLHTPEAIDLASQNILRLGYRTLGPQHAAAVKSAVGACFRNVSSQLERSAQQVARELEMVLFTRAQKDAALNSLRLLGDGRIEGIGLDIAQAVRSLVPKPGARRPDEGRVAAAMTAELQRFELGGLAEDLEMARLLWSEGRQWGLTLESEHLLSMANVSDGWHDILTEAAGRHVEPPWGGLTPIALEQETRQAIVAGALVQARVLLDIMQVRARSVAPSWVTSLSRYLGVDRAAVSCNLDSAHAYLNQYACPLKFGIQGMDALRAHFSEQPVFQEPLRVPGPPNTHDEVLIRGM